MAGTATTDPVPIQGKSKPELKRLTFQKKDRYENEWDEARPETPPTSVKGPLQFGKPRPSKYSHLAAQMETEDSSSKSVTAALTRVQPTVVTSRTAPRPAPKNLTQGKGLLKEAQLQDFQKNAGVSVAADNLHKSVSGEVTKVQRVPGKIAQLNAEQTPTPPGTPPKTTEKHHSWLGVVPEKKPACVPQTIYLPEQRRWFGLGPVYQPTQTVCVPVQPKVNLVDQVKQKGLSTKSKQFYHQDSDRDFFVDKNHQEFPKIKKICPRSDAEFNALAPSTL
ncbi:uncharacterized protein LOC118410616 [Branchiostoma floridae]|uniref:Uncharacterized protein LOC118410616 n=1 Tax=Branchiostoma floridae TaxID=7739 RepID=A0A9J7KQH6_BRAFL|nr:uncharacterized protein LOC118410616 [Branchiostoma floridae]XP_035668291.1 uncharacterized protein LOC118410616 [Branchiostoma floridae]